MPPPGAWDTHAHIFGPADKFPYQPGRGYTPPDAPVERFIALLDHLGFTNGLVVQGNAHVYDNSVVLDALTRFPSRLRGVAITDTRIKPEVLREWHRVGMRGLRFHLFPQRPNYIRGVGLDVFELFRKTMTELGWVVQFFCDHRMLAETAPALRDISRDMTVIVDHLGMVPAGEGVSDPNFRALLKLVGDGHAYVKLSAVYRLSTQFPDYRDAKPLPVGWPDPLQSGDADVAIMKRRSRTGSVKSRRRKAATPKRGNALNATRSRGASVAGEETVVARLARERDEALLREAANSEILSLISRSPGDLELVFRTILEDATRICNANFGTLFRFDGENFNPAAQFNTPAVFLEALTRRGPFKPAPGNPLDHVMRTKQVAHSADMATEPVPGLATKLAGARTQVIVPMVKDDALIGAILIYRQEVRPFTDKQIELVKNFAAQAVIAIENARLLNELRESLQQQTATAEVLKVISSSPSDLTPVFEAILANAVNICGAKFGNLFLCDGDKFTIVAMYGAPAAVNEWWRANPTIRPGPRTGLARLVRTKQVNQTEDLRAGAAYAERDPLRVATVELAGARTLVDIPLLKDDVLVGAIVIYRQEVRLFAGKEIELLTNFAAQAVIAIENARLLNELRQSLEQQTAAADVLRIIASSQGELDPVFKSMLENARHICDAKFGILMLCESDGFRSVAIDGAPPAYTEAMQQNPHIPPRPGSGLVVLVESKKPVQIADVQVDPGYVGNRLTTLAGARTLLIVPLLKDGAVIGAINIYRQEVRAFTEQQIALVQNFAAQAVIAIENARLLNELRQRTEEVVKLNQQLEARVADQVGEIERMGRLRRFLPPQVADLIVASGTERQLESHRREITALFCDLRGFTGFSESSDPEDVMTLLRQYHAAIGEIIIKYSGTLERYAGDGVMVVFNDPVPVDNPALQAVRMALDMRSALGALIEKWRRLGHELGFGIGIAHGYATLGTIGFEGRFDYAAIGTVSNVASRLCDEAKPGQILISPRVLLAVEETVTVEAVGDFELKGIRRPVAAYNVLAPKSAN